MREREFNNAHVVMKLREDFHTLVELVNASKKNINTNESDSDDEIDNEHLSSNDCQSSSSSYTTLKSILGTLKKHHHYLQEQQSDGNDDDNYNKNNTTNFIRTNLSDYNRRLTSTVQESEQNKQQQLSRDSASDTNSTHSNHVSLRTILESKSTITKLLHALIEIMTSNNYNDRDENDNSHNGLSPSSIIACQVYLQICLLSGSWSAGWIDMVAMRYVETILRKWNVLCSEYKMILSIGVNNDDDSNNSRLKRSRLSKDEEYDSFIHDDSSSTCSSSRRNEAKVYEKIQYGIDLSRTLSCILRQVDDKSSSTFSNWNIEARDALFDSTILALGTCSALLSSIDHRQKKIEILCKDTLFDICCALESLIVSSVEVRGSLYEQNHDNDRGQLHENHFDSPNRVTNENVNPLSSIPRKVVITILRNMYPLLTYQVDLPNGVKGKQAAFDKCQSIISNVVRSLSSKLKLKTKTIFDESPYIKGSTSRCLPNEIRKKSDKNNSTVMTPLTGRKRTKRLSLTPKSTNRKKLSHKRDSLTSSLLVIPPSLKKSVTPKRSAHRRSMLLQLQNSASESMTKNTLKKKREEMKELELKQILDVFIAMMQKLSTGQNMERVEVRTRISNFIIHVLENMKEMHRTAFVSFIIRLCSSKVSSHRIFGVELLGSVLATGWIWEDNLHCLIGSKKQQVNHDAAVTVGYVEESNSDEVIRTSLDVPRRRCSSTEFPRNQSISFSVSEECKTSQTCQNNHISREMLTALHDRVMDRSPAVRARVATALSTAFRDIKTLVGESEKKQKILNATVDYIGPNLISSLRERAKSDEKATVRKAALLAFVDLLLIHESDDTEENKSSYFRVTQNDVNVLCQLCSDPSVSVRKAAVDSLVCFLERQHHHSESSLKYESNSLESAWVNFILPLVRDVEPSCVSKVVGSFESLIVIPIFDMNDLNETSNSCLLKRKFKSAWKMLSTINHESFSTGASTGVKNALNFIMGKFFEVQDVNQTKRICIAFLRESYSIITTTCNDGV